MKLKRYSSDAYQIVTDDGRLAFLALRLANGEWSAYSKNDIKLTKQTFASPAEVRDFIAARQAQGGGEC